MTTRPFSFLRLMVAIVGLDFLWKRGSPGSFDDVARVWYAWRGMGDDTRGMNGGGDSAIGWMGGERCGNPLWTLAGRLLLMHGRLMLMNSS